MGAIYEEFQREMAVIEQRYANRPRKELIHLLLMALEREEIVSIAYRDSLMTRRLAQMPIDDAFRELFRHALIWIWKDEEMHTIYVRGTLWKLGSRWLRLRTFFTQLAGGIGGWASSVLQHVRWSQAPFSHTLASLITGIGSLVGKVPSDVRTHLKHGSFRDFCHYNIDAERTAAECWSRLIDLAIDDSEIDPEKLDDFRRVVADEKRHEQIFRLFADSLDESDRIISGVTVESLAVKIAEIGAYFLPRSLRGIREEENPIGSGSPVYSVRGASSDNKLSLFRQLMHDVELDKHLEARARSLDKTVREMHVAIKPTFMLGYHRNDLSPITDPTLLEELAKYLGELGVASVAVIEGRNIYDHFHAQRSVSEVANYFGLRSKHYQVVDASQEQVPHSYFRGMGQYSVSRTWKEADFRISFSKLRSHPIEVALLSLANVEWLGASCDHFLFVEREAQRETAIMMLLDSFPPHFALVEGYDSAPDGLVGMMGSRSPRKPRRIYASRDALALDQVVLRHLGMRTANESTILQSAQYWFGSQNHQEEAIGNNEAIKPWRGPYSNEIYSLLCFLAYPVYRHASGRGALFTPEMDEEAFPEIQKPGLFLRMARRVMRSLLGLHGASRITRK